MSNERVIVCGNAKANPGSRSVRPLQLRLDREIHLTGEDLARPVSASLPDVFADLIEIATYVYVADQAVTRGGDGVDNFGANWRRRLRFTIPVRDPDFWRTTEVTSALTETLDFLSDDEYDFEFVAPTHPRSLQHYFPFPKSGKAQSADEVVLFSGGLDSLGGAVQEVIQDKRRVVLVNHRSTEKLRPRYRHIKTLLDERAGKAGAPSPLHVPVHINKVKRLGREYTQRSRSFLYASIAATIAQAYGLSRIRFYENGVVGLNLPLSPQVVGSKATRTTHPRVLNGFARILSLVADRTFTVENPYIWKTKTDVVQHIVDGGCGELIGLATSCTHTWEQTKKRTHCGTCSQCIDRRFAVLAAGADSFDPGEAYGVDLLVGPRDKDASRTMLAAYVETTSRIAELCPTEFFSRYGEVGRIVRHLPGSPDVVALAIYELYQRHSRQVAKVVDDAIAAHRTAIRRRELPGSSLLRLVCDTGVTTFFGAMPTESLSSPEPSLAHADNVFRKRGHAWVVKFAGNAECILPPSRGAAYLHLLLCSQGRPLSAVKMAFEVARHPEHHLQRDVGEWNDKEARTAYQAQYRELQTELEEAKRNNDQGAVERATRELELLAHELKNRGWRGEAKKERGDGDRIRKAVGNAIRRAVGQIARYDKALAAHLQFPRLICGSNPCYDPGATVDWEL